MITKEILFKKKNILYATILIIGGSLLAFIILKFSLEALAIALLILGTFADILLRCHVFHVLSSRFPSWSANPYSNKENKGIILYPNIRQQENLIKLIDEDPFAYQIKKEYKLFEIISIAWRGIPAIAVLSVIFFG